MCNVQGNPYHTPADFSAEILQDIVGRYNQSAERKKSYHLNTFNPAKLSFRIEGELKSC